MGKEKEGKQWLKSGNEVERAKGRKKEESKQDDGSAELLLGGRDGNTIVRQGGGGREGYRQWCRGG